MHIVSIVFFASKRIPLGFLSGGLIISRSVVCDDWSFFFFSRVLFSFLVLIGS